MIDRTAIAVSQQVLLADIGDVATVTVLREQVIKGLLAMGAHFLGDRFVPFLAIGEDRIDIEHHAAKIEHAMPHDIANPEARLGALGGIDSFASLW